jgi:hypothetical protein
MSEAARTLLSPETTVPQFFDLLTSRELLSDAVSMLAHAMPKREAVWWACLAARTALDTQTPPAAQVALESAEAWVYTPSDANRRACMDRAKETAFDHAAVWAAVGAFWSGGSMVAPELPAVAPADHLTGIAVCGAVQLAVLGQEPERAPEKFRVLLEQAVDIANGGTGRLKRTG